MSSLAAPAVEPPPAAPGDGPAPAVRARGLTRSFDGTTAVAPLDLDVEAGVVTGLLGPNGSGKSTFMRMLVGLVRPDAGTATVAGVPLEGDGVAVRRHVTYAPGELHLHGERTGRSELAFLLRGRDAAARRRAEALAEDLGLPLSRRVRGYSHGMKRQLVFAAVMAPDVPVRVLDEISEGLDPSKRGEVLERLDEDARGGRAVLLSSHHLGEVDRACHRMVFLDRGRIVADESAHDVRRRAARLLHLSYPEGADLDGLARTLAGPGAERVLVEEGRLAVVLDGDDARPFLARLAARTEIPAPTAVEHGRISLRDLYRTLYGVEGI